MSVDFLSKNFPPFQVHHAKKPPRFYPDGFQRNVIDFYFIFSDCRLRKALYLQFSYFIWPLCKYESDSFSIAYDSYCPEDFDVKNPPVSIRHTLFFEEFLARKTPLYDGLHCLLYKGVCDALGFKAEGLTRDYRRLSLL